ncbi:MAG TPA: J domain-containing protein [Desulfobacteraceae bacterium]|nr:J domain-containing protein [Desulfobacteraceae bacterium]
MQIEKCFEILEIQPGATLEEIKAAYRDAVAVWHPDRFAGNARLKKKAERKLKEINLAYETVLSWRGEFTSEGEKKQGAESNVEAVAELSTRLILHACNFIVKKLKGS